MMGNRTGTPVVFVVTAFEGMRKYECCFGEGVEKNMLFPELA